MLAFTLEISTNVAGRDGGTKARVTRPSWSSVRAVASGACQEAVGRPGCNWVLPPRTALASCLVRDGPSNRGPHLRKTTLYGNLNSSPL
jgi:hypothetical protein